jgi:hypothetical protein
MRVRSTFDGAILARPIFQVQQRSQPELSMLPGKSRLTGSRIERRGIENAGSPFAHHKDHAMEGRPHPVSLHTAPYDAERSAQAVQQARIIFERTLCCWTSDLLQLRRSGVNQPIWPNVGSSRLRRAA